MQNCLKNFKHNLRKSQFQIYLQDIIDKISCPFNKDKSVIGIIIGPCGHGKTTLLNKVCGVRYNAGQSQYSLSRDIVQEESKKIYPIPFIIIDSPGTTSSTEKYMHAAYLKEALTIKPINTAFITVKYEPRLQDMINSCKRQSLVIDGYEQKIVFLVTHIDQS